MFSAAIHRKVAITEDLLTAATFDPLAWHSRVDVLRDILAAARGPGGKALALPHFDSYNIELWPTTSAGQPDVRVSLLSGALVIAVVIVEAKYGAPKGPGEDQLAKYLQCEADHGKPTSLVYLTNHTTLPSHDLLRSVEALAERPHLAGCLYWVSWRDIEERYSRGDLEPAFVRAATVLRNECLRTFCGFPEGLVAPAVTPRFFAREDLESP